MKYKAPWGTKVDLQEVVNMKYDAEIINLADALRDNPDNTQIRERLEFVTAKQKKLLDTLIAKSIVLLEGKLACTCGYATITYKDSGKTLGIKRRVGDYLLMDSCQIVGVFPSLYDLSAYLVRDIEY